MPAATTPRCWIFDMDGTLTLAVHDFEAIKRDLGLPAGRPILESLASLPESDADRLREQLDEIELVLAQEAQPQHGALELLAELNGRGHRLGILTRNSVENARVTLQACGLLDFFAAEDILGRESCTPKPEADGVLMLLSRWDAPAADAVMVGDYLFDLQAGRAAGAATVYFDPGDTGDWVDEADHTVQYLGDLLGLFDGASGEGRRT